MEAIFQSISTFFWSLAFLFFFGPIVVIISIIGHLKLGPITIDLSQHSKAARIILAVLGGLVWFAVYIPIVFLANKAISQSQSSAVPASSLISMVTASAVVETQDLNAVAETSTPTDEPVPTLTVVAIEIVENNSLDPTSIVISEVLGNPCGANSSNEFIELYNGGDFPIDVSGWWITDGDEADKIVSWKDRYPNPGLSDLVKTDTTEIPSHGFAVILAPGYPLVTSGRIMPYIFPRETVILTIETGYFLGDEEHGIEVTNNDVIVLYQGNERVIENVVSTYGSPIMSSSPTAVRDDNLDNIPFGLNENECWSVERIMAVNEDVETNWKRVLSSSPGSAGDGLYP